MRVNKPLIEENFCLTAVAESLLNAAKKLEGECK